MLKRFTMSADLTDPITQNQIKEHNYVLYLGLTRKNSMVFIAEEKLGRALGTRGGRKASTAERIAYSETMARHAIVLEEAAEMQQLITLLGTRFDAAKCTAAELPRLLGNNFFASQILPVSGRIERAIDTLEEAISVVHEYYMNMASATFSESALNLIALTQSE